MRVVVCYPVEARHLAQIRGAAPECEVVDAGQEGIAREILEADIFCGHAKVPVPWAEVVRRGRLKWIQSSAAGLDHCLTPETIASDIVVTSASGLFAEAVAEQTLALLQQFAQREFGSTPTYHMLDEKGPDHSKCFKMVAQVSGVRYQPAWGRNKKEAEQRAACNALSELKSEAAPFPSD